jgi:protein-tyrosine phosphatase
MPRKRPSREAAFWMLLCGALFFATYDLANWAATLRVSVPEIRFGWERWIPFLPWTIVPYWSTDILYALSFFLCSTRDELCVHVKRILTAQFICVAVFLIFPLRFGMPISDATSLFQPLFEVLRGFDRPFNQAPSLHIALAVLLWSCYSRRTNGFLRLMVRGWIALTALSTLTTYQHHFFDLPTGLWVGLVSVLLFPWQRNEEIPHRRGVLVGSLYATGGIACAICAGHFGGAAWLALWPAGALLIVAMSYFCGTVRWISTSNPAGAALLAPYLLGVRINGRLWGRREPPAHKVDDAIWVGRARNGATMEQIRSIVHLAPEVRVTQRNIPRRIVPMLDFVVPSQADLDAAVQAIEELRNVRPTLVCCALGYTRSVSATVAWLMATESLSLESAIARVEHERRVVLSARHRAQLKAWGAVRGNHGS